LVTIEADAGAMKTLAVISLLALLTMAEEQAFVLDAVSVAQHPMCSSSGTNFATPHSKRFGSVFEEPGWRIERFHTNAFEPGGPQRENACGLFMLRVVCVAANEKSKNSERCALLDR
jgi:hypothetical protein